MGQSHPPGHPLEPRPLEHPAEAHAIEVARDDERSRLAGDRVEDRLRLGLLLSGEDLAHGAEMDGDDVEGVVGTALDPRVNREAPQAVQSGMGKLDEPVLDDRPAREDGRREVPAGALMDRGDHRALRFGMSNEEVRERSDEAGRPDRHPDGLAAHADLEP